jgi:pimeloyl-ACP methyl ester carboxylesterase
MAANRVRVLVFGLALSACGTPVQPTNDASASDRVSPPADVASGEDAAVIEDSGVLMDGAVVEDTGVAPTDTGVVVDTGVIVDTGVVSADSGASASDFAGPGPLMVSASTINNVMLPASTGCSGNDCRVNVFVTAPSNSAPGRAAPFPVVVISNGFQISASQYQSYAIRLARWGYVVLRWDTTTEGGVIPRSITHRALGNMLRQLPETVAAMGAMGAMMDTRKVVFAGHSRGGKISALAASGNGNALAFVGLDPVDATPPGTPVGPEYPSGAAALASFSGSSVIIGAALGNTSMFGMPCAPTASNYQTFFSMARAPALEVTLAQTGHVQFIDSRAACTTACLFCPSGSTTDATVTSLSAIMLVAASERATRGADASAFLTPGGSWLSTQPVATMPRVR